MRRCLISLLLLAGVAAHAQPMSAEAKAHLERGLRLYDTQRYDEAIVELRLGYELSPHPDFLYVLGQAERLRGNCKNAIDAYKAFLRTKPADKEAKLAQGNIERCQAELAKPPPPVAPPPPVIAPPPPPVETREAPWYHDPVGDTLAGAGLVTAGTGAVLLLLGDRHARRANDAPTLDDFGDEADTAHTLRVAGVITTAAGAALLAGGVIRYLVHERPRHPVAVVPAEGGAMVVLRGSF